MNWNRGRFGYGGKNFIIGSECSTLERLRFGNYVPYSVSDTLPRYRDLDSGLWSIVSTEVLQGNDEVFTDHVGDYLIWKKRRVYVKFEALQGHKG